MEKPAPNTIKHVEQTTNNGEATCYMITVGGMGYLVETRVDGTILLKTSESSPVFNLSHEEVPGHPQLTYDAIAEALGLYKQRQKALEEAPESSAVKLRIGEIAVAA